jgi:Arc/MetJ family transcription regulator
MAEHLVDIDIDDGVLRPARDMLGTSTVEDTVNEALRQAAVSCDERVASALDRLASADLSDTEDAWR